MALTKKLNSNVNGKQLSDADRTSSILPLSKLAAMYDAVVGSTTQFASGVATHTSLQDAVDYLVSGGAIYMLNATITENVTISGNGYRVVAKGHVTVLSGNLTVSGDYNDLDSLKVTGNVTVSGNNNFLKLWISSTSTFTDSGLANSNSISQE